MSHTFILQVLDANAVPFPDSEFKYRVDLDYNRKNDIVTLTLPELNFETFSTLSPDDSVGFSYSTGGIITTASNRLPKEFCPATEKIILCSNNDNQLQSTSLVSGTFPTTISGINVSIDIYGNLILTAPSVWAGLIPPGPHTLNSQTISYKVGNKLEFKPEDFIIQKEFTDFTGFTIPRALNDGIRDSHVNDFYDKKAVWTWTDNSAQTDKTNNILDTYVAIGKIKHKLKIKNPIRLTTNGPGIMSWDTAGAINRKDSKNIVVSYALLNHSVNPTTSSANVSVSMDGGKTFTGPINIDSSLTNLGDARGVIADKYGNFWYSTTSRNADSTIINLLFYVSSDKGLTWSLIFATTDSTFADGLYDYPQINVGNDGQGNYGLWFVGNYITASSGYSDNIARLGFIPTTGLGQFGTGTYIVLSNFLNQVGGSNIFINNAGKVFIVGFAGYRTAVTLNYGANTLMIKNPGILDQSLITQPKTISNTFQNLLPAKSYPVSPFAYFVITVQCEIYDEHRKVLYSITDERPNANSQNYYLYLNVSFDEGKTWSPKVCISDTYKKNRGFSSVALDTVTNSMMFSWYDSRNSKTGTSEQYFGLYLSSCELDSIVKKLRGDDKCLCSKC